jgi:hypothetical protein
MYEGAWIAQALPTISHIMWMTCGCCICDRGGGLRTSVGCVCQSRAVASNSDSESGFWNPMQSPQHVRRLLVHIIVHMVLWSSSTAWLWTLWSYHSMARAEESELKLKLSPVWGRLVVEHGVRTVCMSRLYSVHHIHKVFFLTSEDKPESIPLSTLPRVTSYHYPVHSKERQSTYSRRTDLQLRARRFRHRKRGYIERTSSQRKLLPARATGPVPRSRRKYRDPFRPQKGPGFQMPGFLLITQNVGARFTFLQLL